MPDPSLPFVVAPSEDKKKADLIDRETGEYVGTVYVPEGRTTDDYVIGHTEDGKPEYMFDQDDFVPAGEVTGMGEDPSPGGDSESEEEGEPGEGEEGQPGEGEEGEEGQPGEGEGEGEEWEAEEWEADSEAWDEWPDWGDDWDDWGDEEEGSGGEGDGEGEGEGHGKGDPTGPLSDAGAAAAAAAAAAGEGACKAGDLIDEMAGDIDGLSDTFDAGNSGLDATLGSIPSAEPGAGLDAAATFNVQAADPVDVSSGAWRCTRVDVLLPGIGPALGIVRHYSNQLYADGSFGLGCEGWFDASVRVLSTGAVYVRFGNGSGAFFGPEAAGFEAPLGSQTRLRMVQGRFELLTETGDRLRFDAAGLLATIADECGNSLTVERDAAGRPQRIVADDGRALRIDTDAVGHVVRVRDPANRTWRYEYDATKRLSRVEGPDATGAAAATLWRFAYGGSSQDPRQRANLTVLTDARGLDLVRSEYGEDDATRNRVVAQDFGGTVWRFAYAKPGADLEPTPANRASVAYRTTITDPLGVRREHDFSPWGALLEQRVLLSSGVVRTRYAYDAQGRLIEIVLPRGNRITYEWVQDSNGFDRVGDLLRRGGGAGGRAARSRFTYDDGGHLAAVQLPEGGMVDYVRDQRGLATEIRAPLVTLDDGTSVRPTTVYAYDARGRVTRIDGPDGSLVECEYDAGGAGLMSRLRRDGAVELEWTYDAVGRIASVANVAGATVSLAWNDADQLVRQTGPLGAEREFVYDELGRLLTVRTRHADGSGAALQPEWLDVRYAWNERGFCTEVSQPVAAGRRATITYAWDEVGNLVGVEGPEGRRVEHRYDAFGRLVGRTVAPGTARAGAETFEYDENGNLVAWCDAMGARHEWTYDELDAIDVHRMPDGGELRYDLDREGRTTRVVGVDAHGTTRVDRRFTWNAAGWLTEAASKVIDPAGVVGPVVRARTSYDAAGRPVRVVDASGGVTTMTWSGGTLAEVVDPVGNRTIYESDSAGRLERVQEDFAGAPGAGLAYAITSDTLSRVTSVTDPLGNVERYAYDSRSLLTEITRADGSTESRRYDPAGRLLRRSLPWEGTMVALSYQYDDAGELTAITDPDGVTTRFERDERGQVARLVAADAVQLASYARDALDRVVELTDARRTVTRQEWDELGRLTRRQIAHAGGSAGVTDERYAYDFYGNVVDAQNDDYRYQAAFDSLGRRRSDGVDGATIGYAYAADLTLRELTYPSGARARYARDAVGRATSVTFTPAAGTLTTIGLDWLGAGRLAAIRHGNGSRTTYDYDRAGRLMRVATVGPTGTIESLTLLRDALARIRVTHREGGRSCGFLHDSQGQLLEVRESAAGAAPAVAPFLLGGGGDRNGLAALAAASEPPAGAWQMRYELTAAGDRVRVDRRSDAATVYVAAPTHRYASVNGTTLAWDANGNLVEDGSHRFVYDHENRLVKIEDGAGSILAELGYDPLGRLHRVSRPTGVELRHYVGLEVIEEVRDGVASSLCSAFGVDQPLAVAEGGAVYELHRDQTWSVLAVTDATGALVERYDWDAFGSLRAVLDGSFNPTGTAPRFARYHGRPELVPGVLDFRQRVLLAPLGRFAQLDPAGLESDVNPYRFALNDPYLYVDPTGEFTFIPILVGLLIGAGISMIMNRDKSGADFWIAVGAGAVGGALAGSGLGLAGFVAGGAVSGATVGAWEGGNHGGVAGAIKGGALGGVAGGIAGGAGGVVGARISTGVAGSLYGSLTRGALTSVGSELGTGGSFVAASYVGTAAGGVAGGATGGFYGGVVQGTGSMLANGRGFGESLVVGLQTGKSAAFEGGAWGGAGGVAAKGFMQGAWARSTSALQGVLGEEGEFFAQNQTGNAKATFTTPQGKQPDLWGDALPWADPVYGDVKNTARIPALSAQRGQLRSFLNALPSAFDRVTNPNGNRLQIFYRPGIELPGARHSLAPFINSGRVQLVETTQYVFAPPDTAGELK